MTPRLLPYHHAVKTGLIPRKCFFCRYLGVPNGEHHPPVRSAVGRESTRRPANVTTIHPCAPLGRLGPYTRLFEFAWVL